MLATRSGAAEAGLRALVSGLVLSAVLAGCSAGSEAPTAAIPAAPSATGDVSTAPTETPPSTLATDPTSSPPAAPSAADPTPTADPTESPAPSSRPPAPSGPALARMEPPTLVSATAQGCLRLPGGGREASFAVTFSGGTRWTLLPEDGPTAPTGSGSWRVVVDTTNSPAAISLRHVKVGGGSPFSTAVLPLPPGLVATAAC